MRFAPEYMSVVLNENFEDAKTLLLEPLMAINYAHLVMLAECGIVSSTDARTLREALDAVPLAEVRQVRYDGTYEDLFFYIERLIEERVGPDVAGRLHTARSRNDLAMTMYRLWQRQRIGALVAGTLVLREGLIDLAWRHRDSIFAMHTHTQPAQPSTMAHYLLAVIEQLERDTVRLLAAYDTTNVNPLGACAITGTGFPIDRRRTSALLGFSGPTGNTYGSIAAIDYLLESAGAVQTLMVGLGRVIQDLLVWCTMEFGYVRLGDGFVQGSSIMPQKRNPDAAELVRAKSGRAMGSLVQLLTIMKGLPLAYSKDMQDDKLTTFEAFDSLDLSLQAMSGMIATMTPNTERMRASASSGFSTATDLADWLVRELNIPFREAHHITGAAVKAAETQGIALPDLPLATLQKLEPRITDKVFAVLTVDASTASRQSYGGTAPARVREQVAAWKGKLG